MRVARWLLLAGMLAVLAGCQGLRAHAPTRSRPPELAVRGERDAAGQLASQPKTKTVGILAGQVVDALQRRRADVTIQVASLNGGTPFLVNTDQNGYFVIQGLEPNNQYKLTARTQAGAELLGGTTLASPPNVVVLITLNEKLPPDTPPLQGARQPETPPQPSRQDTTTRDEPAEPVTPRPTGGGRSPARLGSPSLTDAEAAPGRDVPPRLEYVTQEDRLAVLPPTAQIRGPMIPGLNAPPPGQPRPESPARPTNAFAVPLKTLDEEPTLLAKYRGRVTLVLLWSSAVPGGAEMLPLLAERQRRHQDQGLAVAAIAYEEGTHSEVAQRLRFQADRLGLQCPLLLGGGDACPLLSALDIRRLPTLALLDDRGSIIWRAERLDAERLDELDQAIRQHLGR